MDVVKKCQCNDNSEDLGNKCFYRSLFFAFCGDETEHNENWVKVA